MKRTTCGVLAALALGACANRCGSNAAFQTTFQASLANRDDAGAALVPDQDLTVRVDAADVAEISFETWSKTCLLEASRDASGILAPKGEPCRIAPQSSPLALLQDFDAAMAAARAPEVTIRLLSGKVVPGVLDLELEVTAGALVQHAHVHGGA